MTYLRVLIVKAAYDVGLRRYCTAHDALEWDWFGHRRWHPMSPFGCLVELVERKP